MTRVLRQDVAGDEAGQGLIELALVLPVFLVMVFGFISFALMSYGLSNATYANRLLIRYACVHSSTSYKPISQPDVLTIITPFMNNFPANTVATSTSWGANAPIVGTTISTTITITYYIALPGFTLSPLTVQTTASGVTVQ